MTIKEFEVGSFFVTVRAMETCSPPVGANDDRPLYVVQIQHRRGVAYYETSAWGTAQDAEGDRHDQHRFIGLQVLGELAQAYNDPDVTRAVGSSGTQVWRLLRSASQFGNSLRAPAFLRALEAAQIAEEERAEIVG